MGLAKGPTYGTTVPDGLGNIFFGDLSNDLIRKATLNNQFPASQVGTPVTQQLQVHFDQGNLPVTTGSSPNIFSSSFAIAPGISDFTISPIISTWTTATTAYLTIGLNMFSSAAPGGLVDPPLCGNVTGSVDSSLDCSLNIVFTPTAPGLRQNQLVITTKNGSIYNIPLIGYGSGGQLAIDGGAPTTVFTSTATSTPSVPAVAVSSNGTVYIADPGNNRIVVQPSGGGAATTVGTGLKGPMGVAVDATGNVYISDTGNNRIVEVAATGTQTVLGAVLAVGSPAYPQYSFNGPQGIAVDTTGNVYVADTGNAKVVEIPSNFVLGGATPLLQYAGAPQFVSPVAVAVDKNGTLYVADTKGFQIVEIPPGGGDLTNPLGTTLPFPGTAANVIGTGNFLTTPNGVAVDGGGNLYVSDSAANTVTEVPTTGVPNGSPFALTLPGLKSPAGIALDANGNVYVADSGNGRVLFDNRQSPTVQFGTVAQDQPAATAPLTVTNIGTLPVTLTSPFTAVTGTANPAYTLTNTCVSPLLAGATCTITPSFLPTSDGTQTETFSVNGGTQTVTLVGTGAPPLVSTTTTLSASVNPIAYGQSASVTATVSPASGTTTPTGTVALTIDGSAVQNAALSGGTAGFTIAGLLAGPHSFAATYGGSTIFAGSSTSSNLPLTVTPAVLTVTGACGNRIFGHANACSATVAGYQYTDSAATVFSGTPTGATTAARNSPAGSYTATPLSSSLALTGFGTTNYTVSPLNTSFTISGGAPQSILFAPLPNFLHGASYQLTARATSGLPVSYSVLSGNATVSGSTLTVTGTGPVTVQASQSTDPTGDYAPATPVSESFTAQ